MKKNLVFIGAPGSGKGTQSAKLVEGVGYSHVSTGNLLRDEIAKESDLGNKVKSVMEAGQLVSDDLVVELLKANLNLGSNSYIFDGYPRNIDQAKTLDQILGGADYSAVYFKLDTEDLVNRITKRRTTKDGKYIYNLDTKKPKVDGICDVTGEKLIHRDDDKEEVIRKRMDVFDATVGPVIEFYSKKGNLVELNADQGVEEIYKELINIVG